MAWTIDSAHTQVEFAVKHMMISTVRGRFTRFSGTLNVNEQQPELSSAEGSIEAASIDTHDANRDAHLRSADFFDAEKFPALTFRTTKITPDGENRYKVAGQMTIKDVTREVVFEVSDEGRGKDPWGNLHWGFSAQTTLNRKDYGLTWNVGLEAGGWLVGDNVKITIDLEAIYQPDVAQGQAEATKAAA
jgi:polyisoprenoid-binding protein YceI